MSNSTRVTRRMGLRTAAAAAIAMPLLSTAQASATRRGGRRLDVMTFNLRFASSAEPGSRKVRRPVMRELLRRERPHVLGTQEGSTSRSATSGPISDRTTTGSAPAAGAAAATSPRPSLTTPAASHPWSTTTSGSPTPPR